MSNGDHKTSSFEPLHDAHAIEQVVFAVQFHASLDDTAFAGVCNALDPVTDDLPKKFGVGPSVAGQNLTFTIGSAPLPVPSTPYGKNHQFVQPDGVIGTEFNIDRTSIVFRTTRYTRWAETWSRARKYYDVVLPMYAAKLQVVGISLNYVDKFVWNGSPADCRPSLLLGANSKYLCPHVYETSELWHSHTGAFIRVDNQIKRLLNVNVDYLDEQRSSGLKRTVAIGTVLSDLLNQPEYASIDIGETTAISFIDTRMQQLHDFGKMVFANVINEPMSKRIALKA
jgi:uncharacterized protein (TIGR04255 family)